MSTTGMVEAKRSVVLYAMGGCSDPACTGCQWRRDRLSAFEEAVRLDERARIEGLEASPQPPPPAD